MMLKDIKDIGFYTLSDFRLSRASHISRLMRCEMVLTARCNFKCPYCRSVGGEDISYVDASDVVKSWGKDNLFAIRFSGGEPTLYNGLYDLCCLSKHLGIERIAISTNGSASRELYDRLIVAGVNDFSISLDACCAEDGDRMAGGVKGAWSKVIDTIKYLSSRVYTTVGVVVTDFNSESVAETVLLADSLGVADIRVIPAAQNGNTFSGLKIPLTLMSKYPILHYRISNYINGVPFRGLRETDSRRCGLVVDDIAFNQGKHYPCIIYMRESGNAIGKVGRDSRLQRKLWSENHDTHSDPICKANCLDVCREYNNRYEKIHSAF